MGQQVKSWCRQHERLLIFISFLLLSGLSLYFVYFQENFYEQVISAFIKIGWKVSHQQLKQRLVS